MSLSADGSVIAIGYDSSSKVLIFHYHKTQRWTNKHELELELVSGEEIEKREKVGYVVDLSADGSIIAISNYVGSTSTNGIFHEKSGEVQVFKYYNMNCGWMLLGDSIKGQRSFFRLGFSISLSADGTVLAVGINSFSW